MHNEDAPLANTITWLASHALPLYAVLLILVLAASACGWWLMRRYGVHREASRFSPLVYLVGHLVLGFALIIAAAAGFAEIAEALGDGDKAGALDLLFSDALRDTVHPLTLRVFAILTHLGDPITLTVLTVLAGAVLLRLGRRWLCVGLVLTVLGNALLNRTLKAIFERTRPVHDHGLVMADGWSFPSGHSSGSVVVYGMLAYLLLRLLPASVPARARLAVVLVAATCAFTTGCSRVFLQVHFATDVIAGFASGAAWLAVCILGVELARFRRNRS